MASQAASKTSTDREEIRQWAEERGAKPSCVRGTGGKGDIGMLRLDFPGYSGEDSLEEIEWDDWFDKFEERGLALLFQETTADGERSNFNKLVSRETANEQKTAGRKKRAGNKAAAGKKQPAKKIASKKTGAKTAAHKTAAKKASGNKAAGKKTAPKKATTKTTKRR